MKFFDIASSCDTSFQNSNIIFANAETAPIRVCGVVMGEDGNYHRMPLYSGVREVLIGLESSAEISHAPLYKHENPVVFYGLGATHGACASRPGTSYENQLAREFDLNYLNLGFAGGAKADPPCSLIYQALI